MSHRRWLERPSRYGPSSRSILCATLFSLAALVLQQPVRGLAVDADDVRWAGGFNLGSLGPDEVRDMVLVGDDLVAGGQFGIVAGVAANNIVRFDGTTWRPFGAGLGSDTPAHGSVQALEVFDGVLYAGGTFDISGSNTVRRLAYWTGTLWREAARGLPSNVFALTTYNGQLYAGTQSGLYRGDSGSWTKLAGLTGWVFDLEIYHGELIVAGWNLNSGTHIMRWNGTTFDVLGVGVDDQVLALTVYNDRLVAGGAFSHAGGLDARRVASWDGTSWSAFDNSTNDSAVQALTTYGGDLIAGGSFTAIAGNTAMKHVARWNGAVWLPMASGALYSAVLCFQDYNGNLAAGGLYGIASWNGSDWGQVDAGAGVGGPILDLRLDQNSLVTGGGFNRAGDIAPNNIAGWNGSSWTAYATGLDNAVLGLGRYRDQLISTGYFMRAGTTDVQGIARWNGSSWQPLGSGLDEIGRALVVADDNLIVAGDFTTAGGVAANRIARWDGASWSPLGSGMNGSVHAVTLHQGSLFAGGEFTASGDGQTALAHVARWNGNTWEQMGTGLDATVDDFATFGSNLVAVGDFTHAGQTPVRHVAAWDGVAWSDLGGGVDASARTALEHGRILYVGGAFREAGGIAASGIAKWNGMAWQRLGSGIVNGEVVALEVYANGLFVGGSFWGAGDKASTNIARWDLGNPVDVLEIAPSWRLELRNCMDPGRGQAIRIRFNTPRPDPNLQLAILDIRGRLVRVLGHGVSEPGEHSRLWNRLDRSGARVARGVYFVRLQSGGESRAQKLVMRH